jgi:hydroxymethylpyrimidine/phosphomethylpyrimidine kinase
MADRPAVLCFSGHDPSGGAGIQADIETLTALGCHAASVITALTEQDTLNVRNLLPQAPADIMRQARTLLRDIPVACFKIGLIGHADTVHAIHSILTEYPTVPVVLDPVLAAGGGADLSSERLLKALDSLLPLVTILTPNTPEARRLTQQQNLPECGRILRTKGCQYVLITGTHEQTSAVKNQVFYGDGLSKTYKWQRLPDSYHGSGCTLASAIAAFLAHKQPPLQAVLKAQAYTWRSLEAAYRPGKGQAIPNRFWNRPLPFSAKSGD